MKSLSLDFVFISATAADNGGHVKMFVYAASQLDQMVAQLIQLQPHELGKSWREGQAAPTVPSPLRSLRTLDSYCSSDPSRLSP